MRPIHFESELKVERGIFIAFDRRLFGNFSEFRSIADGKNLHDSVSLHYRRTAHDVIRGIGCLGIEVVRIDGFVDLKFSGQGRFVDLQRNGFDQLSVGGNLLAALEKDNIAYDDLLFRDFAHLAVADDLDRSVIVRAVEQIEFFHRIVFEPESDARC